MNTVFACLAVAVPVLVAGTTFLMMRTRAHVRRLEHEIESLREEIHRPSAQVARLSAALDATASDVARLAEAYRISIRVAGDREVLMPFRKRRDHL